MLIHQRPMPGRRAAVRSAWPQPAQQRGIVLMLAIVVLVIMSLAAVGLMRSMLSSNKVAGNLAFQQSAIQSADLGIETAVAWLEQNNIATNLHNSITIAAGRPVGYLALRQDPAVGQSWETFWTTVLVPSNTVNTLAADAAGNTVSFVIQRLCNGQGAPTSGIGCEAAPATDPGEGGSKRANSGTPIGIPNQRYYRITARVAGPRNTIGFVQAVVAL